MKFSKTLGGKRGDENREVLFGHLIFKSGKTIILDEGEVREFENKIRLYKAEGKLGRPIKKDSDIMFICPDCSGNRLECCEDGHYNSEVFNIDEEGDFDYGEINASGEVDRFQCLTCGYTLIDGDSPITEHTEVVEWIKENCKDIPGE